MDNRVAIALAFVAGVLIGRNWLHISRALRAVSKAVADSLVATVESATRYAAEAKERVEDARAEAEYAEILRNDPDSGPGSSESAPS